MNPAEKFLTVHTGELEWEDGENIIGLPLGVEVKIVAEGYDDVSERVDKFVKFPPGYTETLHIHDHLHSTLVIEGEMHVHGKILKPGDFVFGGPGEQHGPFHYPVGCTVFSCSRAVKMNQIHRNPRGEKGSDLTKGY
ncbi:MAG: cupin domain-containing protein [Nitrospinota bacterium]|nr:cupin domain-containing protein [Nitrospinota bacterium]